MAHHQSSQKRIRQNVKSRQVNRYYARSTRSSVKKLRNTSDKETASEQLPKVISMLDKLARRRVIHKNKASNLKSRLQQHVNNL